MDNRFADRSVRDMIRYFELADPPVYSDRHDARYHGSYSVAAARTGIEAPNASAISERIAVMTCGSHRSTTSRPPSPSSNIRQPDYTQIIRTTGPEIHPEARGSIRR